MTSLVALVLAGMFTVLKPIHKKNEALYAKTAILAAVQSDLPSAANELTEAQVMDIFSNQIEQKVFDMKGNPVSAEQVQAAGYPGGKAEHIDMAAEAKKPEADRLLPMYVFTSDKGKKNYILSVRGKGLWDAIWGNIALESDLKTIAGVDFDHQAETPGLGAEIKDNAAWKRQFTGKSIYNAEGDFVAVEVVKGGAKVPTYQVDGISGATITADGVEEMLKRGLNYYQPILASIK